MPASLREIIRQNAREINPAESAQQLANNLTAIDELDGAADAAHVLVIGVDAQRCINRAEKIAHSDRPLSDFLAAGIGFTNHLAAANAAARQSHIERARIMIAARTSIDARRAPELAHPD